MLSDTADYPTTTISGLEANTLADGLFHAGTWLLVVLGIAMVWRTRRSWCSGALSAMVLTGWMLAGWGIFNLVEGTIDHQLLGIHHVRQGGNQLAWDLGFLALGALLLLGGWAMARSAGRAASRRP
jgi:uncharacterized membrane protein